jgi:hypothetical protein
MIHRASDGKHPRRQVGWGRFEGDTPRLLTCDDDEALVVFQDELPKGYYLRAPVPIPKTVMRGMVAITATLLIAPQVDPQNADSYTRGGLEIAFRPDSRVHRKYGDGKTSRHASTKPFFSARNMYGRGEYLLREEGKWEPCRKGSQRFRASSLHNPVFDIYHHAREEQDDTPVPYALVVSLRAPKVVDLYNQVVRSYTHILTQLRPQLQIQVTS